MSPPRIDPDAAREAIERFDPPKVEAPSLRESLERLDLPRLDAKAVREALERLAIPRPDPKTVREALTRLERYLPDTDRDRYERAYRLGREGRAIVVALGFALGFLVGAGAMWLLDPEVGARRRARLAGQAGEASQGVRRATEGMPIPMMGRRRGGEPGGGPPRREGGSADPELATRVTNAVRMTVGDQAAVEIDAQDGVVILRGRASESQAAALRERVRAVSGVREVSDRLDVDG